MIVVLKVCIVLVVFSMFLFLSRLVMWVFLIDNVLRISEWCEIDLLLGMWVLFLSGLYLCDVIGMGVL